MEFFSFLFISDCFNVWFVRSKYEHLIKDKPNRELYKFDYLVDRFKERICTEKYIRFRHSSYSEALAFLFKQGSNLSSEERQRTYLLIEGFSKVALILAENKETANEVAKAVDNYFDKLPKDLVYELLIKLTKSENVDVISRVADILYIHFWQASKRDSGGVIAKISWPRICLLGVTWYDRNAFWQSSKRLNSRIFATNSRPRLYFLLCTFCNTQPCWRDARSHSRKTISKSVRHQKCWSWSLQFNT